MEIQREEQARARMGSFFSMSKKRDGRHLTVSGVRDWLSSPGFNACISGLNWSSDPQRIGTGRKEREEKDDFRGFLLSIIDAEHQYLIREAVVDALRFLATSKYLPVDDRNLKIVLAVHDTVLYERLLEEVIEV